MGRDLKKLTSVNSNDSGIKEKALQAIAVDQQKKVSKTIAISKADIELTENFINEFNYENKAKMNFSSFLTAVLKLQLSDKNLAEKLRKMI